MYKKIVCVIMSLVCVQMNVVCADNNTKQLVMADVQKFLKAVAGNNVEVAHTLLLDLTKLQDPSSWINEKIILDSKLVYPLQLIVTQYEKMQKKLDTTDIRYQANLNKVKLLEFCIEHLLSLSADVQVLTKRQKQIPIIKSFVEKVSLMKIKDKIENLVNEKNLKAYEKSLKSIEQEVGDYLMNGGKLFIDNADLVVSAIILNDSSFLDFIFKQANIDPKSYFIYNVQSPLIKAISFGSDKSVGYFLQKGLDANSKSEDGKSALAIAAREAHSIFDEPIGARNNLKHVSYLNIIKMLLQAGAGLGDIEAYVIPESYFYDEDIERYYNAYLGKQKQYNLSKLLEERTEKK